RADERTACEQRMRCDQRLQAGLLRGQRFGPKAVQHATRQAGDAERNQQEQGDERTQTFHTDLVGMRPCEAWVSLFPLVKDATPESLRIVNREMRRPACAGLAVTQFTPRRLRSAPLRVRVLSRGCNLSSVRQLQSGATARYLRSRQNTVISSRSWYSCLARSSTSRPAPASLPRIRSRHSIVSA